MMAPLKLAMLATLSDGAPNSRTTSCRMMAAADRNGQLPAGCLFSMTDQPPGFSLAMKTVLCWIHPRRSINGVAAHRVHWSRRRNTPFWRCITADQDSPYAFCVLRRTSRLQSALRAASSEIVQGREVITQRVIDTDCSLGQIFSLVDTTCRLRPSGYGERIAAFHGLGHSPFARTNGSATQALAPLFRSSKG